MTREELKEYIRQCPYDALGDYSVFLDENMKNHEEKRTSKECVFCIGTYEHTDKQ